MNEFEKEMCFMVSLYGIELDPADIVPLVGDVDQFFCAAGQPSSHLWVSAPGFGKKSPPLLYDRAWKRLQKTEAGSVESVNVFSFIEGWENQFCDWTATCDILLDSACFQLGASLVSITDAEQQIIGFVRRWLSRIRPAYGIGFLRKRGLGPGLYGIGLSYGRRAYSGPEYEESVATSRWLDGRHDAVWNDGLLRDVYPYNLLDARQLERDIDGRSLRDWIRAEKSRGTLGECPDGHALWTVPGEQIDALRRELAPTGVLFVRQP